MSASYIYNLECNIGPIKILLSFVLFSAETSSHKSCWSLARLDGVKVEIRNVKISIFAKFLSGNDFEFIAFSNLFRIPEFSNFSFCETKHNSSFASICNLL